MQCQGLLPQLRTIHGSGRGTFKGLGWSVLDLPSQPLDVWGSWGSLWESPQIP